MERTKGNWLLYDGDCPFCSQFVAYTRLRDAIGPVRLINAREGGPEVELVRSAGLVIDEGMVLQLDGELYYGDDCLNRLALLSTRSDIFNRMTYWAFKSPALARVSYPVLKRGRALALKLMGREKMGF
ncbi:MAG: DCC1-like thiol-disulfide oxidoreductase family protein [Pseudomonadota bacterium]